MADQSNQPSISDASAPNAGRIYDYLLGGNHNFEIDRAAARQLTQNFPEIRQDVRLIRWFLGEAVRRLADEGYDKFLDFASGLPTVDHIHQIAPKGTKVIYSDLDPVTVSYGQEIVKGLRDVTFVEADASDPAVLLNSPTVKEMFGSDRRVAIGFNGISWFLPDEKVANALETLYDWAAPGSKLYLSAGFTDTSSDTASQLADFYKQVNQPVYYRDEKGLHALLGRWKMTDPGLQPLEKWIPIDSGYAQGGAVGKAGTLVGTILIRT